MAVTYENLIVAGGRFMGDDGDIESILVQPSTTLARGTLLGKATLSGKYSVSNKVKFTTTGAAQTVDVAIDNIVYKAVASGGTGTGTVGNHYKALTAQAAIDLDLVTFATDTTNWVDLGAVAGSEVPSAVLEEEVINTATSALTVNSVVYKKGTFNSQGISFGIDSTVKNTKDDLHNVSIEITNGEA